MGNERLLSLNADVGESFGPWVMGDDDALLAIVDSANLACGFHAGDPDVMRRTVRACMAKGVSIGDHLDASITPGERPALENSNIDDWRDYYSGMLYDVVFCMFEAGAFQADPSQDRLVLAHVFAAGLDPHIITALRTESAACLFDLQGKSPVDLEFSRPGDRCRDRPARHS
jgi:hypothetical protein